jgi:FlaA1/EpsC-like NDP-sugar epimerase
MVKSTLSQRLKNLFFRPKLAVIILGVEYDSYALHIAIRKGKKYQTAFFIDDDPWKHKSQIDEAQLRYPVELRALCRNYAITAVIGTESTNLEQLNTISYIDQRPLAAKLLLVSPQELKSEVDIDVLISSKLHTHATGHQGVVEQAQPE